MGLLFLRLIDHHKAPAPYARRRRIDNPKGEGCGHRGIHSIAAALEDLHPRLGRQLAVGDNDPGAALLGKGEGRPCRSEKEKEEKNQTLNFGCRKHGKGKEYRSLFKTLSLDLQLKNL